MTLTRRQKALGLVEEEAPAAQPLQPASDSDDERGAADRLAKIKEQQRRTTASNDVRAAQRQMKRLRHSLVLGSRQKTGVSHMVTSLRQDEGPQLVAKHLLSFGLLQDACGEYWCTRCHEPVASSACMTLHECSNGDPCSIEDMQLAGLVVERWSDDTNATPAAPAAAAAPAPAAAAPAPAAPAAAAPHVARRSLRTSTTSPYATPRPPPVTNVASARPPPLTITNGRPAPPLLPPAAAQPPPPHQPAAQPPPQPTAPLKANTPGRGPRLKCLLCGSVLSASSHHSCKSQAVTTVVLDFRAVDPPRPRTEVARLLETVHAHVMVVQPQADEDAAGEQPAAPAAPAAATPAPLAPGKRKREQEQGAAAAGGEAGGRPRREGGLQGATGQQQQKEQSAPPQQATAAAAPRRGPLRWPVAVTHYISQGTGPDGDDPTDYDAEESHAVDVD